MLGVSQCPVFERRFALAAASVLHTYAAPLVCPIRMRADVMVDLRRLSNTKGPWRYEFHASFDLPHRIDKLQPSPTPYPSPLTNTGRIRPSKISNPAVKLQ